MKTTLALCVALAVAGSGCLSAIIPDHEPATVDMAQPTSTGATGGNAPAASDMATPAQSSGVDGGP